MFFTGFAELDAACGGIHEQKEYLVYGSAGGGKTSLALSFLYQGLVRDETVALVMRRRPDAALAHARGLGWDFGPYLQQRKLILIEYPEDLDRRIARPHETTDLAAELRSVLDGADVSRLVFDPSGPLFAAAGGKSALRMRAVVEGFAALGATCMYLIDSPEDDRYLAACKDCVYGVLRMEPDARWDGLRNLFVERMPSTESGQSVFTFELRRGEGFVCNARSESFPSAASPAHASTEPDSFTYRGAPTQRRSGQFSVLIAEPDPEHRRELVAALQPICSVIEAHGPGDCLSRSNRERPDLIILPMEMRGIGGIEITRKLRGSGMNVPIMVTGSRMRRLGDRVLALAAGADIALMRPFDLRSFKLQVRNLLARSGVNERAAQLRSVFDVGPEPRRGEGICTSDFNELSARIEAEAQYSRANDLPFTVVTFLSKDLAEEIGGVCSYISRKTDLTFIGPTGAAIVLAEASEADAFLKRFYGRWNLPDIFYVESRSFDGSETFAGELIQELTQKFEIVLSGRPAPVLHGQNENTTHEHGEPMVRAACNGAV